MTQLRADLKAIADLIPAQSSVLDVGCGDGELLAWLAAHKQVSARGIELSQGGVNQSIARGLSVIQGDADTDLQYYPDAAYDYAVLSQTLQTLKDPRMVLAELVRIARHTIISVPNFGHWKNRLYLGFKGRMPVTSTLSYQWYETPNIHFCTLVDFEALVEHMGLTIEQRFYVSHGGVPGAFSRGSWLANLFGEQGVFMIKK